MRVEITRELDADGPRLEIPWADPANVANRFIDLKQFPETAHALAECQQYPALAEFLQAANARRSPFQSAKCDVWVTTELAEDERLDFDLPWKLGSYVDLVFEDSELRASLEAHLRHAERLAEAVKFTRVPAQMEFVVWRCLFHPEERWGFALTLFMHAYGTTPEEAQSEWARALDALGEGLLRE